MPSQLATLQPPDGGSNMNNTIRQNKASLDFLFQQFRRNPTLDRPAASSYGCYAMIGPSLLVHLYKEEDRLYFPFHLNRIIFFSFKFLLDIKKRDTV